VQKHGAVVEVEDADVDVDGAAAPDASHVVEVARQGERDPRAVARRI
jgi:hypothetical protein